MALFPHTRNSANPIKIDGEASTVISGLGPGLRAVGICIPCYTDTLFSAVVFYHFYDAA